MSHPIDEDFEQRVGDVLCGRACQLEMKALMHNPPPAWAMHLARAEAYEHGARERLNPITWVEIWDRAAADLPWQVSTDGMAKITRFPTDPFYLSWVDNWLFRNFGVRVYPSDPHALRALCALRPPDPDQL